MSESAYVVIFLFYGLAFFSMGLAIHLEMGRDMDVRLHRALRFLAAFGLIHGIHEWIEMLERLNVLPGQTSTTLPWEVFRILMLAVSFLLLSAFGASLLTSYERLRKINWYFPISQLIIWAIGLYILYKPYASEFWAVADVWSRYILAIPAALIAFAGLIILQRDFRREGMAQFGQDSLWASVSFLWYGLIGQLFTKATSLPPSNFLNQNLFLSTFGFPVQLLRTFAALAVAIFVIRFMRSFEVVTQRKITELQNARLEEVQRRESLRGEYLKRVVAAQEAERQRIARELHDETGQALTAIGLRLRGTFAILTRDPERAETHIRELETLVARSLDELQRLIANLRPSHLDDLGLLAALRWYGDGVETTSNLKVTVHQEGQPREIEPEVKIALFRVAQEALGNVVKHADAQEVHVSLDFQDYAISIKVEDDGKGFDLERMAASDRKRWGLLGMEERATLLDGQFHIESERGVGTCILVTIPDKKEGFVDEQDKIVARG
jgi:signal transduction histidine kinase